MDLELFDAHTHVVSRDHARYPIQPGVDDEQEWHRDHPVDTEELLALATSTGVREVALVQAISCHGYDTSYVIDSAQAHRDRTVAIGAVRPDDPHAITALRRDVRDGGARGVRLFAAGGPTASVDDPAMRALVAEAGDLGVPVVLLAVARQIPSIPGLVAAFPAVPFVLDHCAFADLADPASFAGARDLFALADLGNLHLKVSSITLRATPDPAALWAALAARFGADRLLWGSDYPHTHDGGYEALVALARESTRVLDERARADVLAGTARRLWPLGG